MREPAPPKFHIDARRFPHNHYPLLKALYRVPARRLAPRLDQCGLTADAITGLRFALGTLAAIALGVGGSWAPLGGLALLHVAMLLDYADGELARMQGASTLHGAWLEVGLDKLQLILVVAGLAIGAARGGADPAVAWAAAFASLSAFLGGQYLTRSRRTLIREPLLSLRSKRPPQRSGWARVAAVTLWREANLYYEAWLLATTLLVIGAGPLWALWATAIYGWPRLVAQWLVGFQRAQAIDRTRAAGAGC